MKTYSNSRISCFEQCPLKFKFNYIDNIKPEIEETVEAFLGKRVHETLEKLYKDLKFQKLNTLNQLLTFYNDEWKKNWNKDIIIVRDEYNQENFRKMGEKFITDYYARYHPFNQEKTIGLETQNYATIGNYKLHVRIDRLSMAEHGIYEIHDYKTSSTLPTQQYLDEDRQLAIYAYGVKTMYPDAKKVKLIWHFLAFDKEMQSERTQDQLEELKGSVIQAIEEIESCKEFPAKESSLCQWCEFRPICPNFKHLFEIEDKPAKEYRDDDGVKLVNEYSSISAKMKEYEEKLEAVKLALIDFAKNKGINIVYGSDVKASVSSYPKLSFPKKGDRDEFFKLVKKIGLWDKLAIADTYELAKMINNGEIPQEIVKLLEKYIERSETVRVFLRKK